MIVRTWRGSVRANDAESYADYLERTGFTDLASTAGNLAVLGLRRIQNDQAEFLVLSLWNSPEAIRSFAGERPEQAVFYPEDERFLVERDEQVGHFEVVHLNAHALRRIKRGGGRGLLRLLADWWHADGFSTVAFTRSVNERNEHAMAPSIGNPAIPPSV